MKEKRLLMNGVFGLILLLGIMSFASANVICYSNSDCVKGFFGNEYCSNNDVYKNFLNSICINPGADNSYCSDSTVPTMIVDCGIDSWDDYGSNYCKGNDLYHSRTGTLRGCRVINSVSNISGCFSEFSSQESLVQNCANGCSNGACNNPPVILCNNDNDCNDNNAHTLDKCENPGTVNSYCNHTPTICLNDNECGTNGFFGELTCQSNNVFQNFVTYICNNPGTVNSSCSNSVNLQIKQDCGTNSCLNFGTNYCKANDVYHSRTCYNNGCSSGSCFNNSYNDEALVQSCISGCNNGQCLNVACYNDSQCNDSNSHTYDQCISPGTANSYCNHTTINCYNDSQCGLNGFGTNKYCKGNDVYADYLQYKCNNPGTVNSSCSLNISSKLFDKCDYKCKDEECYDKNPDVFSEYDYNDSEIDYYVYTGNANVILSGSNETNETIRKIESIKTDNGNQDMISRISGNNLLLILVVVIILIIVLIIILTLIR